MSLASVNYLIVRDTGQHRLSINIFTERLSGVNFGEIFTTYAEMRELYEFYVNGILTIVERLSYNLGPVMKPVLKTGISVTK